jgi:hypothetical protein
LVKRETYQKKLDVQIAQLILAGRDVASEFDVTR